MFRKITLIIVLIFVGIQFIPAEKNETNNTTFDLSRSYDLPEQVSMIMKGACNDCHSNLTRYPWYAKIQPVKYFLADHVNEGKSHLNLSEFTRLPIADQNHKFEEIIETVESKEMPLESYTYFGLHPEANLTDSERKIIIDWAKAQMDYIAGSYPADSLVRKRRTPPNP